MIKRTVRMLINKKGDTKSLGKVLTDLTFNNKLTNIKGTNELRLSDNWRVPGTN